MAHQLLISWIYLKLIKLISIVTVLSTKNFTYWYHSQEDSTKHQGPNGQVNHILVLSTIIIFILDCRTDLLLLVFLIINSTLLLCKPSSEISYIFLLSTKLNDWIVIGTHTDILAIMIYTWQLKTVQQKFREILVKIIWNASNFSRKNKKLGLQHHLLKRFKRHTKLTKVVKDALNKCFFYSFLQPY